MFQGIYILLFPPFRAVFQHMWKHMMDGLWMDGLVVDIVVVGDGSWDFEVQHKFFPRVRNLIGI